MKCGRCNRNGDIALENCANQKKFVCEFRREDDDVVNGNISLSYIIVYSNMCLIFRLLQNKPFSGFSKYFEANIRIEYLKDIFIRYYMMTVAD